MNRPFRCWWLLAAGALSIAPYAPAAVSSVTPSDVAVFHFDYGGSVINNNFACQYKTFAVSFTGAPSSITTTAAISTASPTITLGPGETATKVWSNPVSPLAVFYYFCAASSAPVTTSYTISANDGAAAVTYSGSLVPLNTIKAGNQTINSTTVSSNSGLVTLTVTGTAANLNLSNNGRIIDVTPNTLKSWSAGALRLEASTFKFTNQATTVTNRLSILKSDVSASGTSYSDTYTMTFTLRPVAANSGSGPIWPAAYNLSGNGLKHNDGAAFGVSNSATLSTSQTTVSAAPSGSLDCDGATGHLSRRRFRNLDLFHRQHWDRDSRRNHDRDDQPAQSGLLFQPDGVERDGVGVRVAGGRR